MRSGACTVQQTLTPEAASVLRHSLSLARRRGHAQVTPLHVAATLLSSRASLLRRACLKSSSSSTSSSQAPHHQQFHSTPISASHPLQCRALELCFNVALNRLPTTPGPVLHAQPSLSNALIAALKRAQAHQRRGCIEQQQQQPLLTIKVELEQLIVSILDDPSVSRVMREAGFSSTVVKNNIEDSSSSSVFQCYSTSGGVFSSPSSPSRMETQREVLNLNPFWQTHFLTFSSSSEQNPLLFSPQKKFPSNYFSDITYTKEDIKMVLDVFLRKKRKNTVIVGDCVSLTDGLVIELMGRLERGEVPPELKQTQFITFQFAPVSLRFMRKEDVETNLSELRRKMSSCAREGGGGGASDIIIYVGDLKWTVEETVVYGSSGEFSGYNPVEHLVAEIGRLLTDYSNIIANNNAKIWLLGVASYQTYMRCQMRQPPLETRWALEPVSVPTAAAATAELGLSLHASSTRDSRIILSHNLSHVVETNPLINNSNDDQDHKLSCCPECTSSYEKEVQYLKSSQKKQLPPWLQPQGTTNKISEDELSELRKKWSSLCHSLNHQVLQTLSLVGKTYPFGSSYSRWSSQDCIISNSNNVVSSFAESASRSNYYKNVPKFRRQQSCSTIDFNIGNVTTKHQSSTAVEPSLDSLKNSDDRDVKITLSLGNSLFSDAEKVGNNGGNNLSKLLQENLPWQSHVIPSIIEALNESKSNGRRETWLLFDGNDTMGKRRLALAIAESVLGSADLLLHMNTRKRENEVTPCSEMLEKALKTQENPVVLFEDVDNADTQFLKLLADGFETGMFGELSTRTRTNGHAIFILTRNSSSNSTSYGNGQLNHECVIEMALKVNEIKTTYPGTHSSGHKRKSEWDVRTETKISRTNEKHDEEPSATYTENGKVKKDLSRQSSFNILDLNMKAQEDDHESEGQGGEYSPISSDLTRETSDIAHNPHGFLEVIKNRFVFDGNDQAPRRGMAEFLLCKINWCFEEVFGHQNADDFSFEERVVEEVVERSGCFVNSLFEKWVKDILQRSLEVIKNGGGIKKRRDVRLCFRGTSEKVREEGFMGTCFPNKIHVSCMD